MTAASETDTNEYGPFGDVAAASIDHLNDHHDDTIAFLARVLGGVQAVRQAQIAVVDHDGVELAVLTDDGSARATIPFAERASTLDEAYAGFLALVGAARQRAGGDDLTSFEAQLAAPAVIPTHLTTVTAVAELTPRLRQITVAGGLERFVPMAPDQFVYVLAPPAGRTELTVDVSFTWEGYDKMPEADRPVGAYYTVRRWRAEEQSLDMWVVLHGHGGEGERWGRDARPGDAVALWGPRQAYEPPPDIDALVLLGDETAIPAIAAILESLDAGDRAQVIVVLTEDAVPLPLASAAKIDVSWLTGGAGTLLDAVRQLPDGTITPTTYVWGGGESRELTAIRRLVRDELGLARQQVSLTAYWRRAQ